MVKGQKETNNRKATDLEQELRRLDKKKSDIMYEISQLSENYRQKLKQMESQSPQENYESSILRMEREINEIYEKLALIEGSNGNKGRLELLQKQVDDLQQTEWQLSNQVKTELEPLRLQKMSELEKYREIYGLIQNTYCEDVGEDDKKSRQIQPILKCIQKLILRRLENAQGLESLVDTEQEMDDLRKVIEECIKINENLQKFLEEIEHRKGDMSLERLVELIETLESELKELEITISQKTLKMKSISEELLQVRAKIQTAKNEQRNLNERLTRQLSEKSRMESNKQNLKENYEMIQNLKNEFESKKNKFSIELDQINEEKKIKQNELIDVQREQQKLEYSFAGEHYEFIYYMRIINKGEQSSERMLLLL